MATEKGVFRDRIKELRRVPASELVPDPRNWREHPRYQADALRGLLEEIGFATAVLARETPEGDLMIVDGHLRAETAPDVEVPVLVLDVDEAEAGKLLATLDPLAEMETRHEESLTALLEEVKTDRQPVADLLAALAAGRNEPLPGVEDDDQVAEQITEVIADDYKPTTKPGDLFALGDHRLLCGDSTKPENVARLMGDDRAEVMWTDPPYGIAYDGGPKPSKTRSQAPIANDTAAAVEGVLASVFAAVDDIGLAPGARIYVAAPTGPQNLMFRQAFNAAGWSFHQALVWVKNTFVLGHSDHHLQHEDILYGWKPGEGRPGRGRHKGTRWYGGHNQSTVFEVDRPVASRDHPTMKPVELVERNLENSTQKGDVVVDPFVGSGTTMIASERLGRRCFGVELEPRYADVVVRRWEALTGEQAEVVHGG